MEEAKSSESAPGRARRARKCVAKTRGGCATCKNRRIKCDERRPSCVNCEKIEKRCPGYRQLLRWSTKYEQARRRLSDVASTHLGDGIINSSVQRQEQSAQRGPARGLPSPSPTSIPLLTVVTAAPSFCQDQPFPYHTQIEYTARIPVAASSVLNTDSDVMTALSSSRVPVALGPGNASGIASSPAHIPTMLIEYWFRQICPNRSTFDSEINYNRQIARSTCTYSEAVFTAMQAMSAACLANEHPQLKDLLPSLTSEAFAAVQLGLSRVDESPNSDVRIDLVFAVFSLGTSYDWCATGSLSGPDCYLLESAQALLAKWKSRLSPADALLHAYFSQALTYWEMLLAPLGRGSFPANIRIKRQGRRKRVDDALGICSGYNNDEVSDLQHTQHIAGSRPNSWCGISSEVIHTYGQVLALSRSVAMRCNYPKISQMASASDLLCDMSIAQELQKELLVMDFNIYILLEELSGYPVQTQDRKTPLSHLLQTAEAFRMAALLQLHLTFDELPIPQELRAIWEPPGAPLVFATQDADTRDHSLFPVTLALRLATTLKEIPLESGCTSVHVILYLATAIGLWYPIASGIPDHLDENAHTDMTSLLESIHVGANTLGASHNDLSNTTVETLSLMEEQFSQRVMEITNARNMVKSRLGALQQILPHASSGNVLRLVKFLWRVYDASESDNHGNKWFKILGEILPDALLWS